MGNADSVAKEVVDNEIEALKSLGKILQSFWLSLADYLEEHARNQAQREMAKWIRSGGQMGAYKIRGNCNGEVKTLLTEAGISYLNTADPSVIFVREPDLQKIQEINKEVNIARCNYFQEVDADQLEDVIAKYNERYPDREHNKIFTLENLTTYEAEVIKNKCNNITKGFMVGTKTNPDGTVNVSIRSDMVSSDNKVDFCKAYLLANLSLYGANQVKKMAQIDDDKNFEDKFTRINLTPNMMYITGSHDVNKRQYISINETGFKVHLLHRDETSGKWLEVENENPEFSFSDPNAKEELYRALDKIMDKSIIYSAEELGDYLQTGKASSYRTKKDANEISVSQAEKELANAIDKMIDEKIAANTIGFENPKLLFDYYKKEAAKIMEYVSKGEILEDYSNDQLNLLDRIVSEGKLDVSKYEKVSEKMESKESNIKEAVRHNVKEKEMSVKKQEKEIG